AVDALAALGALAALDTLDAFAALSALAGRRLGGPRRCRLAHRNRSRSGAAPPIERRVDRAGQGSEAAAQPSIIHPAHLAPPPAARRAVSSRNRPSGPSDSYHKSTIALTSARMATTATSAHGNALLRSSPVVALKKPPSPVPSVRGKSRTY